MFFYHLLVDGGAVMWLIAAAAMLAAGVFLVKAFQFHREEINVRELINGLENVLRRDGFVEAISLCDNTPGPAARDTTTRGWAGTRSGPRSGRGTRGIRARSSRSTATGGRTAGERRAIRTRGRRTTRW